MPNNFERHLKKHHIDIMWKEGMRPILKSLQSVRLGRVLARKEAGQQCVTAGVMTHRHVCGGHMSSRGSGHRL